METSTPHIITLRSRIWSMEPRSMLSIGPGEHSENTVRVTVNQLKPYDPQRLYAVKKTPPGVTVMRIA